MFEKEGLYNPNFRSNQNFETLFTIVWGLGRFLAWLIFTRSIRIFGHIEVWGSIEVIEVIQ